MYASNSQATFSVSNFSRTERNSNGRSGGDSRNVRTSTGSNIDRKQAEMMKHFMQAMNAFASGFSGTAHAGTGTNGSKGSKGSNGHCGTSGSQAGGKGSAHGQTGGMGSGNAHGKDDCHTQGNSGRGTSGKNDCNTQSNGGRGTSGKNDCNTQSNGGRGTSGKDDCNSHGKEDNHCNNSNGKDDSACDWTTSEVKNNQTSVDLGNYKLDFNKADSSMILTNKTTGDATQVWGDPHIDFHSAGASSKQNDATFKGPLTFQLPDNTKVTLGTQPVANNPGVTVTNKVTITQGKNSIVVDNLNQFNGGDLQVTKGRDGRALDAAAPDGYTLVQQKDGKGWVGSDTGRAPTQADFDKLGV